MPATTGQAQYSLAFALGAMMAHGRVGPPEISGAGLSDPAVEALLPHIAISESARHSERFPAKRCADISVFLADGRVLHSGDVEARGGPEAPLSEAEVEAKFHLFAAPALGDTRAKALWAMRHRLLEADSTFAELVDLVTEPI
jgi:2-methylcitrate dehydratase PrpD